MAGFGNSAAFKRQRAAMLTPIYQFLSDGHASIVQLATKTISWKPRPCTQAYLLQQKSLLDESGTATLMGDCPPTRSYPELVSGLGSLRRLRRPGLGPGSRLPGDPPGLRGHTEEPWAAGLHGKGLCMIAGPRCYVDVAVGVDVDVDVHVYAYVLCAM